MEFEKCPICENHAPQKTHQSKIVNDFLGTDIIRGIEHTLTCTKCEYRSDKIFTPIIKFWWKSLLGR